MQIKAGYDLTFRCNQPTPMLLALSIHPSRFADLTTPHQIRFEPPVAATNYTDGFGNICTRLTAPAGDLRIFNNFRIGDTGLADPVAPSANQTPIDQLPEEVLVFLLG